MAVALLCVEHQPSIPPCGIQRSAPRNVSFRLAELREFLLAYERGAADHLSRPLSALLCFTGKRKESAMMKLPSSHLSPLGLLALAIVAISPQASAQQYPSNMIRMMVPSPAGTPPDIMGRIFANELSA